MRLKRLSALILAAALTVAPMTVRAEEENQPDAVVPMAETAPAPLPFTDVAPGAWYEDNVRVCYEENIMTGNSETTFSPEGILREEECATLAARIRARERGEALPAQQAGEPWYGPVLRYLEDLDLDITPGVQCSRGRFLVMLGAVLEDEALESICQVDTLPDTDDPNVLRFYRAGILNGMDPYGTFSPSRTLKRSEAAAMVSRILRTELRTPSTFADYSPFRAAGVTPSTRFFTNGVTAETFLGKINELIAHVESVCLETGIEFNWHIPYDTPDAEEGKEDTFLDFVTDTALEELGVDKSMGSQSYAMFDVQVYYSRLLDLREGQPLYEDQ